MRFAFPPYGPLLSRPTAIRAEQIDALRLEGLDEAVQNPTQHRIASLQVPSPTNHKL